MMAYSGRLIGVVVAAGNGIAENLVGNVNARHSSHVAAGIRVGRLGLSMVGTLDVTDRSTSGNAQNGVVTGGSVVDWAGCHYRLLYDEIYELARNDDGLEQLAVLKVFGHIGVGLGGLS